MNRLRRLLVLALVGWTMAAIVSSAALAQRQKVHRIGLLSPAGASGWFFDGIRIGLKELGYTEGENIALEFRGADGHLERLPALARELVDSKVEVIVTSVTQASLAAVEATAEIPIVMVAVGDPVDAGLVRSLARPGGNVTGTSGMSTVVVGKQLELLKTMDPTLSHVAVLWNPTNVRFQSLQWREAEAAGQRLQLQLNSVPVDTAVELADAFVRIRQAGLRAVHILVDPLFSKHRTTIAGHLAHHRLIAVSGNREFVEAGGLLAYGPNYLDTARRSAVYVDKILNGAKAADLPVGQPTSFELVVNLGAARQLGLVVPESVLARADEVIE